VHNPRNCDIVNEVGLISALLSRITPRPSFRRFIHAEIKTEAYVHIWICMYTVQGGPKKYTTTNFSKNRIKDCQRD